MSFSMRFFHYDGQELNDHKVFGQALAIMIMMVILVEKGY